MKNAVRCLGITTISAVLALIATIFRCIASVTSMDYFTGFYGGATLINIANIVMAISVLAPLASLFLKAKGVALPKDMNKPLWYIPSAVMAIATLWVVTDIFSYVASRAGGNVVILSSDRSCIVAILAGVLALCAVAFFASSALSVNMKSPILGYLGMGAALFFGMYAAFLFFRLGSAIHQPQKIVTEIAAIAAALFLLEETRIALGKDRWQNYLTFGAVTAMLSAYAVLPALTVYIVKGRMIAYSLGEAAILLSVLIFAICRTVSAVKHARATADAALAEEEVSDIPTEDERQIPDEENTGN